MNFEELDEKMRRFEQSLDQVILPELYPVPGCHDRYGKASDAVRFQDRLRLYGKRRDFIAVSPG